MNEKEKELIEKILADNFVECDAKQATFIYEGKWYAPKFGCDTLDYVFEQFTVAIRNVEKQVMEKYNSIGRVVEESSKIQLDKWEEAIRKEAVVERDENILNVWGYLIQLQKATENGNTEANVDEWNLIESIKEKIDDLFNVQALKGQKEGHGNT